MNNPEDHVLDAIAELVDESIAHGPTDDYDRPYQERCELCRMAWHGLPRGGCPGAHATPEEQQRFREAGWTGGPAWQLPGDPFDPADWWPEEYTDSPYMGLYQQLPQFPHSGPNATAMAALLTEQMRTLVNSVLGIDFGPLVEGFADLEEQVRAWLASATPPIHATTWLPGDPLPGDEQ